jgi:transaldolase
VPQVCSQQFETFRTPCREVSLEVSPYLAINTQATLVEARRLWRAVGRDNLMIKVPATVREATS